MKRILLSAAAAALLVGPGISQAQPDDHRDKSDHRSAPAKPAHENTAPATRQSPPVQRFNPQPSGNNGPRYTPNQAPSQIRPSGQSNRYAPQNYAPRDYHRQDDRQPVPNNAQRWNQPRPGTASANPNPNRVDRSGNWNRNGNGGNWNRNGNGGNWNRGGWSGRGGHDQGWWRQRRGFERYEGRRDGYWFAPGWGYYQPDPRWYGFDWEIGVTVPYELRDYYVSDPYDYGLPPAPYGYQWIYLGNQLVMIDLRTGQIVQFGDGY